MADTVSRETIKPQVIDALMQANNLSTEPTETDRLNEDLGMGSSRREAMAVPYTKISAKYQGNPISPSEAKALETVGKSIDLVYEKANRRK